jgi:hypothetical protein
VSLQRIIVVTWRNYNTLSLKKENTRVLFLLTTVYRKYRTRVYLVLSLSFVTTRRMNPNFDLRLHFVGIFGKHYKSYKKLN